MGRKEAEENENAKFFVRILPGVDFCDEGIKIEANCKVMHVKCLQKRVKVRKQEKQKFWCFSADDVFWNRSQEYVYESVCGKDFVENVLEGVSGVILAYGQTGSGKTFTVSGLRHHYQNRGIVLRLLTSLCDEREASRDVKKISVAISYAEFVSTRIKDLLRNAFVEKINEIKKTEVGDEIDAWKSIFESEVRKSVNETAPYLGSHRGHTILTFHVETLSLIESNPLPTYSKVHIVDMAGIDPIGNVPSSWRSDSDLEYSNLSKTMLEQLLLCVSGRTWKNPSCVCPTKATKMLEYLHDALQPYCMIRFVGHVLGNEKNLPLTLSVLRFGEKIRGLKPTQLERDVKKSDLTLSIKALEEEIERLRAELDFNDMLNDSPNYSNMSQERLQQIRRAAKNFLLGHVDSLTLLHLGQAEITLEVFKEVYENLSREKDQAVKDAVLVAIEEVQAQLAADRSHTLMPTPSAVMKVSRRRSSRHRESRVSLLQTADSSDSAVGSHKPSATSGHGVLDRNGISIGSGKGTPPFEGLVTKSMKRMRSRMSDIIIRPAQRSSSAKEAGVPSPDAALPEKVPSKEQAWQEFCTEKSELVLSLQEEISRLEESVRAARKNYTVALCELGRVRDALERLRREGEEWNHVRQTSKFAEQEPAASYGSVIGRKEVELNSAMEHCHVTLIDFRNSADELAEARAALENEFQIFCGELYKFGMVPEEKEASADLQSAAEDGWESRTKMEMYFLLQKAMTKHVTKRSKPKWVALF